MWLSQPETEWDEQEQAWMLALAEYRASRCPGCGGNLAETTASGSEGKYGPDLPLQCFQCEALGRSHDAYVDQPQPRSFLHVATRR